GPLLGGHLLVHAARRIRRGAQSHRVPDRCSGRRSIHAAGVFALRPRTLRAAVSSRFPVYDGASPAPARRQAATVPAATLTARQPGACPETGPRLLGGRAAHARRQGLSRPEEAAIRGRCAPSSMAGPLSLGGGPARDQDGIGKSRPGEVLGRSLHHGGAFADLAPTTWISRWSGRAAGRRTGACGPVRDPTPGGVWAKAQLSRFSRPTCLPPRLFACPPAPAEGRAAYADSRPGAVLGHSTKHRGAC